MAASFVNVDLEVTSREPLDYLALALSEYEIRHLYCGEATGGYLATFECNRHGPYCPDSLVLTFTGAVNHLDERAKGIWDRAHRRTFDIGYEADARPGNFRSELNMETIKAVYEVGATVVVTIYPRKDDEVEVDS
ncbi:hypothetical protein FEM03_13785 [Phragmitibacter flavus]|uniref:Uncharacterized protein n=1 Tax=Phragmitibacter flavus TaxID=2576071 RepID=A0A5R8KD76_9BACT|nr:hypothetical protein [Phragmitibacter flavus]TLD70251.1 hypothetical protein FEM03_13785 [Phragmitibacter flavus]